MDHISFKSQHRKKMSSSDARTVLEITERKYKIRRPKPTSVGREQSSTTTSMPLLPPAISKSVFGSRGGSSITSDRPLLLPAPSASVTSKKSSVTASPLAAGDITSINSGRSNDYKSLHSIGGDRKSASASGLSDTSSGIKSTTSSQSRQLQAVQVKKKKYVDVGDNIIKDKRDRYYEVVGFYEDGQEIPDGAKLVKLSDITSDPNESLLTTNTLASGISGTSLGSTTRSIAIRPSGKNSMSISSGSKSRTTGMPFSNMPSGHTITPPRRGPPSLSRGSRLTTRPPGSVSHSLRPTDTSGIPIVAPRSSTISSHHTVASAVPSRLRLTSTISSHGT